MKTASFLPWLACLVAVLPQAWAASAAAQPQLRLCHNQDESFPWIMKATPGFSQILATEAARQLNVDLRLTAMPWEDCLRALREGKSDGAVSAAFAEERLQFAAYPMAGRKPDDALRMYNNSFSLFQRKGDKLAWDGKTLTVKGSVGVRQGSSIGLRVKALGASVDDSSTSYLQLLRRLSKGEFAAVALETQEGNASLLQDFNLRSTLVSAPLPLLKEPFFTIFSKTWADRNPALAKSFWQQEQKLRKSPDFALKVRHLVKTID